MVILKMDILSDLEVTKRELITLDAKLLKNSDFYNQIQTLVKAAAASELTPKRILSRFLDFATSRRDARQLLVAQGRVS